MKLLLQITEFIYNISFIVFTFILVVYTVKSYNNEKKQPYKLIARINYSFNEETNNNINMVVLDIFNCGDYTAKMVKIQLIINHNSPIDLDCINFIAPKENFKYYLGKRIDNTLILFDGKKYNLANPLDYDYFDEFTENNIVTLTIRIIESVN